MENQFSLKHRLVAFVSQRLFDNISYTARSGLASGLRRKGGLGFVPRRPTIEEEFLRNIDYSGKVVYDIGCFIGITTMFFASRAKQVIAFEPNPTSAKRLVENLEVNRLRSKVDLIPLAVGDQPATLRMSIDTLMAGGATLIEGVEGDAHITVTVTTIDSEREKRKLPAPDFMKIDIEGFEYPALIGMKQTLLSHRPGLFIEMHGHDRAAKLTNAERVVNLLLEYGYRLRHIESGTDLTAENWRTTAEGHVYAYV
jgi:FkbM family methyltransferase